MLGAMTLNVGVFFAIVSGVSCGFLFMGHLFVSSTVFKPSLSTCTTERHVPKSCRYPQRVDVACSPQFAAMEGSESPAPIRASLLSALEILDCGCSV